MKVGVKVGIRLFVGVGVFVSVIVNVKFVIDNGSVELVEWRMFLLLASRIIF